MPDHSSSPDPPERWQLIRDVCVFQLKLAIDGLRDLVLGPVSIAAALVGLLGRRKGGDNIFYSVLRYGRSMESWINLFGAVDEADARAGDNIDDYLRPVENALATHSKKRGLTASAKAKADGVIDSLRDDEPS